VPSLADPGVPERVLKLPGLGGHRVTVEGDVFFLGGT